MYSYKKVACLLILLVIELTYENTYSHVREHAGTVTVCRQIPDCNNWDVVSRPT